MGPMEAATKITVKLPDGTPLELPDGAAGADAAAAIGPGLAKAALAIRVDGELRDLAAPLPDGAEIAILTDRDPEALELIRHDAAHVMAEAVMELYPGTKVTIGPPIEQGFYYDFEFPPDARVTEEDLERIEAAMRAHIEADEPFERRDVPVGEAIEIFREQGQDYKVELIEDLVRDEGVETVSLYRNGPFEDLCRGPHGPATGRIKAIKLELAGRRLLARRREPRDADPDLRHRLLLEEGPRPAPGADRAGEGARPPPARPAARHLHAAQGGAGDALLAAPRDDPAAADRGRGAEAAAQARVRRDQDAAADGRRALAPLRPLGQLPGEHVLHRVEGAPVRDPADELPRRLPRLRLRAPLLPRAAAAGRRVRPGLARRARGRPARPAAGARLHPGRRPHLLHAGADRRRGDRDLRGDRRALRPLRLRRRPHRALDPAGEVDRQRGAVGAGRSGAARGAGGPGARATRSTPATAPSTGRRSTSTSPTRSAAPGSAAPARSTSSCPSASTSPTPTRTTRRSGR